MLQKTTFLIVMLLCGICSRIIAQGKNFEGKIEYSTSIKSKSNTPDNILQKLYGTGVTVFIKDGYYKQIFKQSSSIEWALYDYKSNRLYNKLPNRDTLYYFDCAKEKRKVEVSKSNLETTILNYLCKSIIVQSPNYKFTTYYSSQLPLNPQWFSKHNLEGYNRVVQYSKSVWLKMIAENKLCIITSQAINIKKQPVSLSLFKLPSLPIKEIKQQ